MLLTSDILNHFFNDVCTQHLGRQTKGEGESRWGRNWVDKLGDVNSQKIEEHQLPFSNHQREQPQPTCRTICILFRQQQVDTES